MPRYPALHRLIDDAKKVSGWSMSCIERVLDLPSGYLEEEKKKALSGSEAPPELIALLKIIKTLPWVLDVAENNYDESYAKKCERLEGFHAISDRVIQRHSESSAQAEKYA